jgi:hypothetical protein
MIHPVWQHRKACFLSKFFDEHTHGVWLRPDGGCFEKITLPREGGNELASFRGGAVPSGRRPTRCHPSPKARSSPSTLPREGAVLSFTSQMIIPHSSLDHSPFKEQPLKSRRTPKGRFWMFVNRLRNNTIQTARPPPGNCTTSTGR